MSRLSIVCPNRYNNITMAVAPIIIGTVDFEDLLCVCWGESNYNLDKRTDYRSVVEGKLLDISKLFKTADTLIEVIAKQLAEESLLSSANILMMQLIRKR